jgi:hypothetical protein
VPDKPDEPSDRPPVATPASGAPVVEIASPGSAGARSTPPDGVVRSEIASPGSAGARSTPPDGVVRSEIGKLESQPVSSGRVHAVTGAETSTRMKSLGAAAADALGGGVKKLGSSVEAIGGVVEKLGDMSAKVPLVGSSVATLGVGITTVGESLSELPAVAATRAGRVLLRSMAVGFLVVGAWIAAIVGWQVHTNDPTDFRPLAERVLVELSGGSARVDAVYEAASPRFQEMVREDRFEREMADERTAIGRFREITAINETLVTTGPAGRIGRVALTAAFDKVVCRGTLSFHDDDGTWKLLGVAIELPPEMQLMEAGERRAVDDVCPVKRDPVTKTPLDLGAMDPKACPLHAAAVTVLTALRDGKAGEVWDDAAPMFKRQEDRTTFEQVARDRATALGAFRRIVAVTEARYTGPDELSATFDGLVEYVKGVARVVFVFDRDAAGGASATWRMRSLRVVVPMPRLEDGSGSGSGA